MNIKKIFFLSLIMLSFSGSLLAQATTIPADHPSLYKGVRPTGMGNAFIAMPGQDENAMFYNPAAINDYEKSLHMRLISPVVDFSPSVISLTKDVIDLADKIDKDGPDAAKIADFRAFVDKHTGEFETVQFRLPVVTAMHKWFALSLLADSRTTFSFRNRAFTNIELNSRSDFGGIIGTAYNFKDALGIEQNIQAGVNVKVIHRYSIDKVITADDIVNNASFGDSIPRNRSTGVGFDIGVKGDVPTFGIGILDTLKPTAGLTWQDVGNTRFGAGVPDTDQSISVGIAVHPMLGNWQFHIANDLRELNTDSDFMAKWNIGAEVVAPTMLGFFTPSVRVGGNQGYISTGASFDFRFFKLEGSYYGEEVGKFTSQKQLRRVAANISFGF
ncbi:MAG: hypothetical protein HY073_00015 [Deltaproteobacteria bacterium]|nr:hypothetical protein [Deltaproteobacteria bacterium]